MGKRALWLFGLSIGLNLALGFLYFKGQLKKLKPSVVMGMGQQADETTNAEWASSQPLIASYHYFNNVVSIEPDETGTAAVDLPDELVVKPGIYRVFGKVFNLERQGLYRFMLPQAEKRQVIVHGNDVDTLLSSICWIATHGNLDDHLKIPELIQKAKQDKIYVTCGTISEFADALVRSLGRDSRVVSGITLDQWNSYDDGHTLIEIYRPSFKKWVLYDLDNNCYLERNNQPLSLVEVTTCLKQNLPFRVVTISSDMRAAISSFTDVNGYNYGFLSERISTNDSTLKEWYKRVLQVPIIEEAAVPYYTMEDGPDVQRIAKRYGNFRNFGSTKAFINRFYAKNQNLQELLTGIE